MSNKIKLTDKQKLILQTIGLNGVWKCTGENVTTKKLISLGLIKWNDRYDGMIYTEKGKGFEL